MIIPRLKIVEGYAILRTVLREVHLIGSDKCIRIMKEMKALMYPFDYGASAAVADQCELVPYRNE